MSNYIKFIILVLAFTHYKVNSQSILDKEYLFDDFKYTRVAFPATGDSSSSMFGKNPWITKTGVEHNRAWRRYGDADTNSVKRGINMVLDSIGITLTITKDFISTLGYYPQINSDFLLQEGTFAARIKYQRFNTDKTNKAFFLWSPVMLMFGDESNPERYWSEIDFEFNNCWYNDNNPRIKIGCNNLNGILSLSTTMDCITRYDGKYISFEECTGSYQGHNMFEENWIIYVFRINKLKNKVEIAAFSDDDSLPFDIWGGLSSEIGNWGRAYTIPNYYPQYKMATYFSIGSCSDLTVDHSMKIDWFFYSPNPELSGSEILEQVKNLKKAGIERINTTQIPTFTETSDYASKNLALSGPLVSSICMPAKWKIEPLYKGRHIYHIGFKYRNWSSGIAGLWKEVLEPEINYIPSNIDDSLEIMLVYQDEWQYGPDTVIHICKFDKVPCDKMNNSFKMETVYPNPVNDEFSLNIDVYKSTEISIAIFDKFGFKLLNIYTGFLNSGRHDFKINVSQLAVGSYYIRAISGISSGTEKFIKLSY